MPSPRLLPPALAFCILPLAPVARATPNILLLIADDYGIDSCSLYNTTGASQALIPNITALAQSGVRFTQAWAQPVCSPTRACLITGRHAFRTGVGGVIGTGGPSLSASEFTLPEAFAAHPELGYSVASFGKWHLATAANSPATIGGWPHYAGNLQGGLASYTSWAKTVDGTTTTVTTYATTDLVDDVIAWTSAQDPEKPWFAWVAFNAPHTPFHKPPDDLHSYDSLSGTAADINANPRPYYEAATEAMDTEIGRLLATIDLAHTIVIFLGDNGTPIQVLQSPYTDRRGKDTIYEGGVHVPLIIAGPGIVQPGRADATLTHVVDLYATILELAGIDVAATVPAGITLDSRSLVPALTATPADRSPYLFAQNFGAATNTARGGRRIRDDRYALLAFLDGHESLYDLATDPYEYTDLLANGLSTEAAAHYHALTLALGGFQNELAAPAVTSLAHDGTRLTLTVPAETGVTYQLWRGATPDALASAPLDTAEIVDDGTTVTLTDPAADTDRYFYRVVATKP